ncbi:hypothetical protein L6452_18477 [Arctium lappa]|uniref:Uncharacterized protein n=1 Tax=Arctium lappa TaxID=4217 RepID=A0ACB9C6K8_ARCLA|nr:hypothetical protein L6452_18477 [Arctium lappa]
MWMRTHLRDYGYTFHKVPIYCDSKSAIAITPNPVQHSKTKHIDIRKSMAEENIHDQSVQMDDHDPNVSREMPMPPSRSHFSEVGADTDLRLINPQDYLPLSPNSHHTSSA